VPFEVAEANDEQSEGRFRRAMVRLTMHLAAVEGAQLPRETSRDEAFRSVTATIIRRIVEASNSVIVGRARSRGAPRPRGCIAREIRWTCACKDSAGDGSPPTPRFRRNVNCRRPIGARRAYVRHFYGRDWADPALHHLIVDSTAIPIAVCTLLVLSAAAGRRGCENLGNHRLAVYGSLGEFESDIHDFRAPVLRQTNARS
jgi:hypothetical protein